LIVGVVADAVVDDDMEPVVVVVVDVDAAAAAAAADDADAAAAAEGDGDVGVDGADLRSLVVVVVVVVVAVVVAAAAAAPVRQEVDSAVGRLVEGGRDRAAAIRQAQVAEEWQQETLRLMGIDASEACCRTRALNAVVLGALWKTKIPPIGCDCGCGRRWRQWYTESRRSAQAAPW